MRRFQKLLGVARHFFASCGERLVADPARVPRVFRARTRQKSARRQKQPHGRLGFEGLECRARELLPGGKLLIVSPGDAAEHRLADGLYDALNDACLDLVADGRLERQRYERFTMPLYFRTVAETLDPLERDGSPVKGAFTVDRAETLEVPTPFLVEFDHGGDAAKLADDYTGFLRAFSEPVARAALVGDDGDSTIIDELYGRIHARVKTEPQRYRFHYLLTATLFTRRRSH